jgi:hypothetical protein
MSHVSSPSLIDARDAEWTRLDHTVVNWIYTTISKAIFNIVYQPCASAYTIWTDIEGFFRDNELQCAVLLKAEFRSLQQGAMSVSLSLSQARCSICFGASTPSIVP